ncbi:MAG TPA: ABC transporter permease [Solirubrobacterales bacterium]|nr:ABC transporter permease [Solirubrobacterales bacterium]
MKRWLYPTLLLAALLGLWQILADSGALADVFGVESFLVPSPSEIASSLWDNRSLLAENAWVTLREILLGFGCALVAGIGFAIVLHLSETLRTAFYPLLVGSQAIPILVFAPVLIVLFGYGIGPKLMIVAIICFFPITVNALDGLRSVDADAVKMMRTLDASRWQTFQRVEAPTALPSVFSGAKVAVAVAVIAVVFAEWAGSSSGGLGWLVLQYNNNLRTAEVFATALVLALMAIGLFGLLALAERLVVTWR